LFEAQYQTETKLRPKELYPPVTKEEANARTGRGLPVIDPDKLRLGVTEPKDLLQRICAVLAERTGDGNSPSGQLLQAVESGQLSPDELARKSVAYDRGYFEQLSERMSVDKEEIVFIAEALVAPFLRVCATSIRSKVNLDLALSKRCPVCGGAPLMGKFRREDGRRMFECSLCGSQWMFERLRCPSCGNEHQDTLGFFFVGEGSAFRVDKCDKCRNYVKTVDERQGAENVQRALALQDVATLYLDIIAAKEGYQNIRESPWKESTVHD